MSHEAPVVDESIEVVAGVLRDGQGRVLLAQRPPGKHLAGTWEFPGGKKEPGESGPAALRRELGEELGVAVRSMQPWLALTHRYPEVTVRLQLYTIGEWTGTPSGREGQALHWATNAEMNRLPMPEADRPIVRAFSLDPCCAIAPEPGTANAPESVLAWARAALDRGIRLFRLQAGSLDPSPLAGLCREFGKLVESGGGRWLFDGAPEIAAEFGAHGAHLDGVQLNRLSARPLSGEFVVGASCRDEAQLARAGELALDFVTLSPVRTAARQHHAACLGWQGFERLCRSSPLPVYALGGVSPDDLARCRECGGFGVAGHQAFGPWR